MISMTDSVPVQCIRQKERKEDDEEHDRLQADTRASPLPLFEIIYTMRSDCIGNSSGKGKRLVLLNA